MFSHCTQMKWMPAGRATKKKLLIIGVERQRAMMIVTKSTWANIFTSLQLTAIKAPSVIHNWIAPRRRTTKWAKAWSNTWYKSSIIYNPKPLLFTLAIITWICVTAWIGLYFTYIFFYLFSLLQVACNSNTLNISFEIITIELNRNRTAWTMACKRKHYCLSNRRMWNEWNEWVGKRRNGTGRKTKGLIFWLMYYVWCEK